MGRNSNFARVATPARSNGTRALARMTVNAGWLKQLPEAAAPKFYSARPYSRPVADNVPPNSKTFTSKHKTYAEALGQALRVAPPAFRLDAAAAMIPHPAKALKGGEDAYFIAGNTIGIADGVGGWEAHGIDSGLYSRSLMKYAGEMAESDPTPLNVLKGAHALCSSIPGSSTACVLSVSGNQLEAANLGDSGFLVIRKGQLIYKTREQQHYFNCPFQIGSSRDTPDDADLIKFEVEPGDVVVMATDGVFDNLSSQMIVSMAWDGVTRLVPLNDVAQSLALEAQRVALDPHGDTPFAEGARKVGQVWNGGKLDDITVLVACVGVDSGVDADICMEDLPSAEPAGTGPSIPPKRRERN